MPTSLIMVIALAVIGVGLAVAIGMNIKRIYQVPKANEILVRTGGSKVKISEGGGMLKLPWIHEIARMSAEAVSISINRVAKDALRTHDKYLAEVEGTMPVQVDTDNVEAAARAMGAVGPKELERVVRETCMPVVTDAMRSAAFKKTFEQLNLEKDEIGNDVRSSIQEDLQKLGIKLVAVTITDVRQQPFDQNDKSVHTAEGRRNEAMIVQKNLEETNLITKTAEVKIARQNVDAAKDRLTEDQRQKRLIAEQRRQVEEIEATQRAESRKAVLLQQQAEEEAAAAQARAVSEAQAKEAELAEKAEITRAEQVAIRTAQAGAAKQAADETAAAQIAEAAAGRKVRQEAATQSEQEAEIAKNRAVETARIQKEQAVKVADEARQQAIEEAEVARQVAVAEKRTEEAIARAAEAVEKAKQIESEEKVTTAQETEQANRRKSIVVIEAEEEAEQAKIAADQVAYVVTKTAEGERDAATKGAEAKVAEAEGIANAQTTEAKGYAEVVKTKADADAEASEQQATARTALAGALLEEGKAQAESIRLKVEAENKVALPIIIRDVAIEVVQSGMVPASIRELMAPVGQVAGKVQVLQVNGLGGEGGTGMSAPEAILGTGMALTGALPLLKGMVKMAVESPDVQEIVKDVTEVATSGIAQVARAAREGVEVPGNGG